MTCSVHFSGSGLSQKAALTLYRGMDLYPIIKGMTIKLVQPQTAAISVHSYPLRKIDTTGA